MFTNYYVESGDFKTCVMNDDPRKAVLHAITNVRDELEDSSTIPRLESLIRVSPNSWQEEGMKETVDIDVEFHNTKEILEELGYVEILNCLKRQEEEYFSSKPEEA